MYKVAKQNMLTPEAHLNIAYVHEFKTSSASAKTLFLFSHLQAGKNCLFEIHPARELRRRRAYLSIYLYVRGARRGARSEFPSGAEIEPRAQSVMQAREEFCSRRELI
jgi:hypothetical protein